jgi:hypothetical protein
LAAYGCRLLLAKDYPPDTTIEVIFDHVEKVESKLAKAADYADSDSYYGDIFGSIACLPLPKNLTFKNVIPLQAADLLIWELRKNHLNVDEWFSLDGRPANPHEHWRAFQAWSYKKYGTWQPKIRKSLKALIDTGAPTLGIVWDYNCLCEAHRARGGVWSVTSV